MASDFDAARASMVQNQLRARGVRDKRVLEAMGRVPLLQGEQISIKPENFDEVHDRSGIQHRLKDPKKWVPLGIGPGQDETAPEQ